MSIVIETIPSLKLYIIVIESLRAVCECIKVAMETVGCNDAVWSVDMPLEAKPPLSPLLSPITRNVSEAQLGQLKNVGRTTRYKNKCTVKPKIYKKKSSFFLLYLEFQIYLFHSVLAKWSFSYFKSIFNIYNCLKLAFPYLSVISFIMLNRLLLSL